jgi:hypothetical protein
VPLGNGRNRRGSYSACCWVNVPAWSRSGLRAKILLRIAGVLARNRRSVLEVHSPDKPDRFVRSYVHPKRKDLAAEMLQSLLRTSNLHLIM